MQVGLYQCRNKEIGDLCEKVAEEWYRENGGSGRASQGGKRKVGWIGGWSEE